MNIQDLIDTQMVEKIKHEREYGDHTKRLADLYHAERAGQVIDAATVEALRGAKDSLKRQIEARTARIGELETAQRDDAVATGLAAQSYATGTRSPAYDRVHRVGQEQRTYVAEAHRGSDGPSFLRDLYSTQVLRDPSASERIARHGREVEVDNPKWVARAMGTGAVAGFVPPQYLVELFAEYARAGRPVANLATSIPLPATGMTITLTRVTTPTIVSSQATENSAVANQDADDTILSVPVITVAGYVDVSRQSLERAELVEMVVLSDLSAAYNAEVDRQVIAGSGASNQHTGLLTVASTNAVTYTDATPTAAELWPKLASALGQIQSLRYTGATALVMHPNTWAWLMSSLDTTGRPIFDPSAASTVQNSMSVGGEAPLSYGGPVASIMGVPVTLSGNVPTNLGGGTNETRIIAADFRDVLLFEDGAAAPMQMRFEEPLSSSLGVRLLAYGYSAFTAGRQPKGVSVISGTGLITPAL